MSRCRLIPRRASARRRSTRLRALNNITAAITRHIGLPSTLQQDFNSDSGLPLTADEAHFLDQNDLEKYDSPRRDKGQAS